MESPAAAATATRSRTAFLSVPGLALSPRPLFSTFDFLLFYFYIILLPSVRARGVGLFGGRYWRRMPGCQTGSSLATITNGWLSASASAPATPPTPTSVEQTRGFAACPPCCCLNIFLEIFLCFSRLLRQEFHLFYALSFLASCLHILCRYFSATLKGALVDQVIVSCRYTQSGQTRNTEWKRTERNRDVGHFPRFQFSLNTPIRTATSAGI